MRVALAVLGLASALAGCSSSHRYVRVVQKQAAFDFNCPQRQIQVTPYGGRDEQQFVVQGCGHRAMYRDMGAGPVLASAIEGAGVTSTAPMPPTGPTPPPPPPPPAP